jgi:lysozyme
MKKETATKLKIGAGLLILLLLSSEKTKAVSMNLLIKNLTSFLPPLEGFSATPYWDVRQWTWGYGTRVPGSTDNPNVKPPGTITPAKALDDLLAHTQNDLMELLPLVVPRLNANKWTAFLSFSYNEGIGNAKNLLPNINSGNDTLLELQWKKYIYADGKINTTLVARRNAEWALWKKV